MLEYEPIWHETQLVAAELDVYSPAEQLMHQLARAAENWPAEQLTQLVEPGVLWKLPAAQSTQESEVGMELTAENMPVPQFEQANEAAAEYMPGEQLSQNVLALLTA